MQKFLPKFRRNIKHRKVLFIYVEDVLANLIYRFFPDPFIFDLIVSNNKNIPEICIVVLSFEDRGIAIGCHGDYIKTVNIIFENYITFKENFVKINCKVINRIF